MSSKQFLHAVKKGKKGQNIGVSTGIPKLDSVIYGTQKKCLITVGADTGSGKTSFTLVTFVYNLLMNRGDKDVSILFYSFEMAKEALYAKLMALYLWDKYQVIVPYKKILSLQEVLDDETYELIQSTTKFLELLDNSLTIYDKALSPAAIYATMKGWLSEFGEFMAVSEHTEDYIPKDGRYKVVLWDHVGLIGGQGSKKERIDTVVDYAIYFRNKCDITGIFVQQLNRNSKSMDRKLNGYELVSIDDFKDTSGTTDASEIVLALFFPYREKIARCEGYPIQNVLKKKFRLLEILKNRYGDADVNIGLMFYGEIGLFKELPKPEEIGDYEPYLQLDYHLTQTDDEKQKEDEENENVFKF